MVNNNIKIAVVAVVSTTIDETCAGYSNGYALLSAHGGTNLDMYISVYLPSFVFSFCLKLIIFCCS